MRERRYCVFCSAVFTVYVLFISGTAGIAFAESNYGMAIFGWFTSGVLVFLAAMFSTYKPAGRAALEGGGK